MDDLKRVGEFVAWAIGVFSAIVGFVEAQGGLVRVLVQLGIFGFACYVSAFVVVPLVAGLLFALEKTSNRESTNAAMAVALVVGLLGGGVLIRFGLFHDSIGDDLDAIGVAFSAIVGVAILAAPAVMLWWRVGSRPVR